MLRVAVYIFRHALHVTCQTSTSVHKCLSWLLPARLTGLTRPARTDNVSDTAQLVRTVTRLGVPGSGTGAGAIPCKANKRAVVLEQRPVCSALHVVWHTSC